jgi:hypothetical protein
MNGSVFVQKKRLTGNEKYETVRFLYKKILYFR